MDKRTHDTYMCRSVKQMIGTSLFDIKKRVYAFSDLALNRSISIIWIDDDGIILGVDELERFDKNAVVEMVISRGCNAFVFGNWKSRSSPPDFGERLFEYERLKENCNG